MLAAEDAVAMWGWLEVGARVKERSRELQVGAERSDINSSAP
jgi:hypothetical protein